jgi:hypothetical protein
MSLRARGLGKVRLPVVTVMKAAGQAEIIYFVVLPDRPNLLLF